MNYSILALVAVFAVELFVRLPILSCGRNVIRIARAAVRIIVSDSISDDRKEKLLLNHALAIAKSTVKILVFLLIIVLSISIVIFAFDLILGQPMSLVYQLATIEGFFLISVFSVFYLFARGRLVRR
jgi:hypothetical protein